MPPALVAELAQHTTNFYLLAFSLRNPLTFSWRASRPGIIIRYIVLPRSLKKNLPANSLRLRMRWYLYRKYFLSNSNYRDGSNTGPLSRILPTRFLPVGLGERDRPERLIPHPLSRLSTATRTCFATVSLYARSLCRSQTLTSSFSLPGFRAAPLSPGAGLTSDNNSGVAQDGQEKQDDMS